MKILITAVWIIVNAPIAKAEENSFAKNVKASLVFRDEINRTNGYPHVLKVYLRLDNVHDSQITWLTDKVRGIKAELLDASGIPVPQPPSACSIQSSSDLFLLPYGSSIEWLISHGGVSMSGDTKNNYAVMVGGQGWLIPINSAASYRLRISLFGLPGVRPGDRSAQEIGHRTFESLINLPPTIISVAPNVEQECPDQPATAPDSKVK